MRNLLKYATLACLSAVYGYENPLEAPTREKPKPKQLTDDEKKRIHQDYNNQFHKYTICGVEIVARSKKDAKKIYQSKGGTK